MHLITLQVHRGCAGAGNTNIRTIDLDTTILTLISIINYLKWPWITVFNIHKANLNLEGEDKQGSTKHMLLLDLPYRSMFRVAMGCRL